MEKKTAYCFMLCLYFTTLWTAIVTIVPLARKFSQKWEPAHAKLFSFYLQWSKANQIKGTVHLYILIVGTISQMVYYAWRKNKYNGESILYLAWQILLSQMYNVWARAFVFTLGSQQLLAWSVPRWFSL